MRDLALGSNMTKQQKVENVKKKLDVTLQEGWPQNIVSNLSSKQFSDETIRLLNLGLSFVLTPAYNPFRMCVDLFRLIRN